MGKISRTAAAAVATLGAALLALPVAAAGQSAPPPPTVDEAYACRSDMFAAVDGQTPGGSHVAGITEAANGDLLFTFNGHWVEGPYAETKWGDAPVTRVFLSRLEPGERTWTAPARVDYPRPFQIHNAVLAGDGEGRLLQFFTVLEGMDHTQSTLEVSTSADHGRTWSAPTMVREQWGWMFGTRPLHMSNGELLVPVYRETSPNGAGFLVSSDGFDTWEVHPEQEQSWPGQPLAIMASTVELEDGHLLAFMRSNGGRILQTHSFDYGRTWTPAVPTQLESPWARVALLKLDSGNLVVAHNPHYSNRAPLQLAMSEDGGLTWPHTVLVETDPDNRFDYPYLEQSSDGFIHVGYTHNNKSNMRHAVVTEEFIRSGPEIPTDVSFGRTEVRDGEVARVDACAYVNGGSVTAASAPGPGPGDEATQPSAPGDDGSSALPSALPSTGGGAALVGLLLVGLGAAVVIARRRP
ncbi:MAG TPA: exo-alpha-sialidase [Nitriliruptorales bacterium]